jgi:hypothetical protein
MYLHKRLTDFHKGFTQFHNVPVINADLDLLQLPVRNTKPTPIPPLPRKAGPQAGNKVVSRLAMTL